MTTTTATPAAPFDAAAFKAGARQAWDRSAPGWDAHTPQIRAWLASASAAMLEMAGIRPGERVLDVAAGAGDQTIDIARRVGSTGTVVATDLSPAILERAAEHARDAGFANIETQVADGEALPFDAASFDRAICRLGLMLMPQPALALRELHRVLKPGAGCCVMVFGRPERNPCVTSVLAVARRHAGLPAPDARTAAPPPGSLLSLGAPGLLDRLFAEAGFREVATTALDAPFRLPSARHYLDFLRAAASPIQQMLARLAPEAQQAAWDEMAERLAVFEQDGAWIGPNELLLTAARR